MKRTPRREHSKKRAADRLKDREARKRSRGHDTQGQARGQTVEFLREAGPDKPSPDDLRKLRSIKDGATLPGMRSTASTRRVPPWSCKQSDCARSSTTPSSRVLIW